MFYIDFSYFIFRLVDYLYKSSYDDFYNYKLKVYFGFQSYFVTVKKLSA